MTNLFGTIEKIKNIIKRIEIALSQGKIDADEAHELLALANETLDILESRI